MAKKNKKTLAGTLSTINQTIRKIVFGNVNNNLDNISKSLNRIQNVVNYRQSSNLTDFLRSLYSDKNNIENKVDTDYQLYEKVIKKYGLDGISSVENDRINRYNEYKNIVFNIPYMKKALKIMTQNILTPEDYTKQSLIIKTKSSYNDEDSAVKEMKEKYKFLIEHFEIEDYLYDVVYSTMFYGDYFIEIVPVDEILKKVKLVEKTEFKKNVLLIEKKDGGKVKLTIEDSPISNLVNFYSKNASDGNKNKKITEKDIFLNYLIPHRVVKIGDKFTFGYIVFNREINDFSGINSSFENDNKLNSVVNNILDTVKSKTAVDSDTIDKSSAELKKILAKLIIDTNNQDINIRFVPPEYMQHFTTDTVNYSPYGTSMLYGSEFLAKIIIAIESSIMMQRLTRSIDKRVIKVELGVTRDATKYLKQFQEQMQRRRYSVDSLGTIDSIASNLSTYEDIYIPMKNGKSYVDFNTLPAQGELTTRIEDLKGMIDSLLATTEVPPAYVGVEDNINAKSTLAQQNIVFSSTIVNYQKQFSKHFTNLFRKMSKLFGYEDDYLKLILTFQIPISLVTEKYSEHYDNVSRIASTLVQFGIPNKYIMDKFMNIDISEIEKMNTIEKLSKPLNPTMQQAMNNQNNLGGGLGGGFDLGGGGGFDLGGLGGAPGGLGGAPTGTPGAPPAPGENPNENGEQLF